ncbi:hypothetical protein PRZ48_008859 [Zasmidium cellare]|uniref:Uncharacterized protein n=1 Tax=Zasmidium cellare TaxID=395010 RepID=A0ABR0EHP1_ZASCE|nr:hypothetical protein PRZ48_008859 [Zasmidium cellare]
MAAPQVHAHTSANGDVHQAESSPKISPTSIPSQARQILTNSIINNESLNIPKAVKDLTSNVVFAPEVEPFLPTSLKMSESASALWATIGLFANAICKERYSTEEPKKITVDVYSATLMLASVFLFEVDGKHFIESKAVPRAIHLDKGTMRETYRNVISNVYKTADGKFYHLHGSLNADPTLNMLGLPLHRPDLQGDIEASKDVYRSVVGARDSKSIEIEANERWRQPGATCLTMDHFSATPHGKVNIQDPLYKITTTNDHLPPTAWPQVGKKDRSLAGIKVLDLTKVIAGPTVTRVLALMGADVLRVSAEAQPEALIFISDGQIGKRDTDINIKTTEGKHQLDKLIAEADVIVSSYRPGTFEKFGLGREWAHELARRRGKGLVYCRENCYGWNGEWSHRAGYQQISDAVTGASWEQGKFLGLDEPVMPLLPNSDSQTGLTGAISIMHALLLRSTTGGSYNISISLNQFNNWFLRNVGLHSPSVQTSLRALHPDLNLRHDTGIFEMAPVVMAATKRTNAEMWDKKRFTKGVMRWGVEGEEAVYLDWRGIVRVEGMGGEELVELGFEYGSCRPGSDQARFL